MSARTIPTHFAISIFNVLQLVLVGHSTETEANHLVSTKRWFLPRPKGDQQTRNDRSVRLHLDAYRIVAQQVATPQNIFENRKKVPVTQRFE